MIPILSLNDDPECFYSTCKKYGFFYLNNKNPDGSYLIDPCFIKRIEIISRKLFSLRDSDKLSVSAKKTFGFRGYFSSSSYSEINKDPSGLKIRDNKEGFFFASHNLFGVKNRIPSGYNEELAEIEQYMDLCSEVCKKMLEKVGFVFNNPICMFKLLRYPSGNGSTDAHTDYGCVTLLLVSDSGLEINIDNKWIPVPYVQDTFIINIGDTLQYLTNGELKSTIHRVIHKKENMRYSLPFFYHADPNTKIEDKTLLEVLDEKFSQTYKY